MPLDGTPQRISPAFMADLERAHLILARVVEQDIAALPIFERLDAELLAARAEMAARRMDDPRARARALAQARKAN
ncbi:hypothetical protein SAMN05421641_10768 [Paracoccus thiocyanatus]|uniref:Chorismate mutase n=1 Tax=Paracoccus thiocyanatus TaxID=34006 RepID=A0A1N6SDG0_9RHOB|nr:hypothetical protein [Paracoccus thiocyanatus]SIQ39134.1 hypothetical protein SAMN05421641_10768 [Paracoccus thiocyanatus]